LISIPIDASADEPNEALEAIRQTLMSPGWQRWMAPALAQLMDHVKNQLVAPPFSREEPYNKWSEERISGFVTGIGVGLNSWIPKLQQYDRARALAALEQRAAAAEARSEGSPYGNEDHTEAVSPQ